MYAALDSATVGDTVTITWSDEKTPTAKEGATGLEKAIRDYMGTVLPDGLPKAQQDGKQFKLTFKVVGSADAKNLSVTCVLENKTTS